MHVMDKKVFIPIFFIEDNKKRVCFSFAYAPTISEMNFKDLIHCFENRYSFLRFVKPKKKSKYLFISKKKANSLKFFKSNYRAIVLSNFFSSGTKRKIKRFRFLFKKRGQYLFSFWGLKFCLNSRIPIVKKKKLNIQISSQFSGIFVAQESVNNREKKLFA